MLASAASLLIPLALTTSLATAPTPSLHREVRAFVTGYNTVPGQTDATPCIAASGADICGRRDAVACPRTISLGTTVEIRGETYVCEDRLAKKFDARFDISCDKDKSCPPSVTGWTTIKVYDDGPIAAAQPKAAHEQKIAHELRHAVVLHPIRAAHGGVKRLLASASAVGTTVLRGRG